MNQESTLDEAFGIETPGAESRDCPLCASEPLEMVFIYARMDTDIWPITAVSPDYEAMSQAIEGEFDIPLSEVTLKKHWDVHVPLGHDEHQEGRG